MNISSTMLKKLPAAILLVGAIVLMQIHAIEFWQRHAGQSGILWSLLLEGAALWLWAQHRWGTSFLAAIATALVLAGPLYQISTPALQQWQQSQQQPELLAKREAALLAERQRLTASLKTYNQNSQSRVGWAGRIDQTNADLTQINHALNELYAEQAQAMPMGWQALVLVAMQLLSLVIFQTLIVLCIRQISRPVKAAPNTSNQQNCEMGRAAKRRSAKQSAKAQRLMAAA